MAGFISSLSPNYIPPHINQEDDFAVIRERILQYIMLGTTVVGLFFLFADAYIAASSKDYLMVLVYTLIYAWVLASTLIRRLPYRLRAINLLVILFIAGVLGLAQFGLASNGRIFLLAFSIMATLLLGLGAGSITLMISIITLIFGAVLKTSANPLMSPNQISVNEQGASWVSAVFAFIIVDVVTTASLQIIVLSLQRIINGQKKLTEDLKDEQAKLSKEVERRTAQLTVRANQLEASNQISQLIAKETNLDKLCTHAADQIAALMNFYYVGIYLLDERKEFAVMQAGTGEAGQELLSRHHSLKVGEIGMVSYAVSRGETKVAQNVFLDPVHYKNPLLPDTKSESAIPLIASKQTIGAIDIQSTSIDAFTPDIITTLQTIADQLAIAIDRSHLLQRLQETLSQLDTGYRQFTQSAWKSFLGSTRDTTSYRFRKGEGVSLEPEMGETVGKLLRANNQQPVTSNDTNPESGKVITALAIPVMLRNQILGVIDVRFEGDRISKDTLSLLESTSARLAIALENARLLEESQNRANREHLVSDVSARVRGSTEVSGILQTAASELGRALGVSEVLVQLRSSNNE